MRKKTPAHAPISQSPRPSLAQTPAPYVFSPVASLIGALIGGLTPLGVYANPIATEGDVSLAVPASITNYWSIGGSFYIGRTGTGTLVIRDGATVRDSNAFIGQEAGSVGTASVTGNGSTWTEVGNLYVANYGTGTMNIADGASVSDRYGYIANNAGSVGVVNVSGVGSLWTNRFDLSIAASGSGTLNIEDGGAVSNDLGSIGDDTTGVGVVNITGAGSTWTTSSELTIGLVGRGSVNILDGGKVISGASYVGNFFDSTGTVQVSGSGSSWSASDTVNVGYGGAGTLTLAEGGNLSVQNGAGTLSLGTFESAVGTLNLGGASSAATDAIEAGTLSVAKVEFGAGTATLNLNHTDLRYNFAPMLISTDSGTHRLNQLAGNTVLSADNSGFNGTTTVSGGTLIVANALGGSASVTGGRLNVDNTLAGPVTVDGSGTLAGVGTISGSTRFTNGGVLVGTQGQTLNIGGDLTLANTSQVNVALGGTSTQALFNVGAALTLDGTLNISSQGGFGAGSYRVIDYQGTLTDNGMTLGTLPSDVMSSNLQIQTAVSGQVNVLSSVGVRLNFWDGSNASQRNNNVIDGGSGVWQANDLNWTTANGALNGPYQPDPNFAVFQGTAGTVTVDNSAGAIAVTGLQIASDGYRIEGDDIALIGGSESIFRVGDSSAASASMTGTLAASLSGASTLVKTDFGTLVLAGNNTYSGGTDIRGGVLAVSSNTNLGAASGSITFDGGALATTASFDTDRAITLAQQGEINVASNTVLTLSGNVTGSGELYKSGDGTLNLTGTNDYLNTRIEAGTVVGNTTSISGSVFNSAALIFDQAVDGTYAGTLTGRGMATKSGTGTLTLSGISRHFWTIEDGTLITSAERYIGNTQIETAGALRFEQAANATYAGVLSGSGTFSKTGAGQLSLTGNSSAFTGSTDIQSGTLVMGNLGQLGGTLTMGNGTTLMGTGLVGTTLLQNGATVAPGNSIGTLRVAGDLTFSPGSTYLVEADPNSTASDRIEVTGTANLAGSVVHVGPEGNFDSARQYTILTANAVQGQFASVQSNFAFLDPSLGYTAQNVTLELVRKQEAGAFADAALTDNQRATAIALDSLASTNALHEYILTLPEGAPPAVFDNLSGELHASVASALRGAGTTLNSLPLTHLRTQLQTQVPINESPVWIEYVGNRQTLQHSHNAAEVKQDSNGVFVGTDYAVGEGWRLGGALGYTQGDLDINDRASKADLSNYSATLFGGKAFDAGVGTLNLLFGTAYTWHDLDTRRYANVSGSSQKLTADYSASTAQVFSEVGYAIPLTQRTRIEPFAGLVWSDLRTRGFSESGGSAALEGKRASDKQTSSTLGLRTQTAVSLGGIEAQLRTTLGWQHAFNDVVAHKTMAFDGSQPFTVAGAPIARNSALVGLGADVPLTPTTRVGLNYNGQYGEGNREHAGILTFNWRY